MLRNNTSDNNTSNIACGKTTAGYLSGLNFWFLNVQIPRVQGQKIAYPTSLFNVPKTLFKVKVLLDFHLHNLRLHFSKTRHSAED